MSYPGWIVQTLLANSRVPEWQNNMPRLNLFSYYETVIAIAQVRLKLASITNLIYNSPSTTCPQTKPFPVKFHITSHAELNISMKTKKRIQKKGLLNLQSMTLNYKTWLSVALKRWTMNMYPEFVYILELVLLALSIVRFRSKSYHRTFQFLTDYINIYCLGFYFSLMLVFMHWAIWKMSASSTQLWRRWALMWQIGP